MPANRSPTVWRARWMSVPHSNSTQIVENPTGSDWDLSDWRRTYETLLRLYRKHCAEVAAS